MRFPIPVTEDNYQSHYLQIMNGIFKLSQNEIKVLETFILLDGVTNETRKQVQEALEMKSPSNLNNYIKSLKDKGVFQGDEPDYTINPLVIADRTGIHFDFVWKT